MDAPDKLLEMLEPASRALGLALADAQLAQLAAYAALTWKWNRIANLTGARSVAEFATRHIVDCLSVCPYMRGPSLADIGSGAGLPGIVLAIAVPEVQVQLVEARGKRIRFLEQARIELGLANVEVIARRLEDWRPAIPPASITCRAYGPLSAFVTDTRALQHPGCRLIAMKGRDPAAEVAALGRLAPAATIERIAVPGWESRHVVLIDCDRIPAGG